MPPESQNVEAELQAFVNFFATFNLSRPLNSADDLNDGAIFYDILSLAYELLDVFPESILIVDDMCTSDGSYFRNGDTSEELSDNWVLRFSSLKRLYRLMSQYFPDVLQKSMASLEVPNLQAIAKDSDPAAILSLCRLTVVIGVQCEKNKEFIEKIQGLSESDQHFLMRAIEQVRSSSYLGRVGQILTSSV